jgi:hypothetical protein
MIKEGVLECGNGYFSKCFSPKIHQNNLFFYLKKLFLTSAHQKDLKTPKKY